MQKQIKLNKFGKAMLLGTLFLGTIVTTAFTVVACANTPTPNVPPKPSDPKYVVSEGTYEELLIKDGITELSKITEYAFTNGNLVTPYKNESNLTSDEISIVEKVKEFREITIQQITAIQSQETRERLIDTCNVGLSVIINKHTYTTYNKAYNFYYFLKSDFIYDTPSGVIYIKYFVN